MKRKLFRIIGTVALAASLVMGNVVTGGVCPVYETCAATNTAQGINVRYHSQAAIRTYIKQNVVDINRMNSGNIPTSFSDTPSATSPYKLGAIHDYHAKSALSVFNAVRYIAGIDYDVRLNAEYTKYAQAAALVNAANNDLSHYPNKPAGMSDDLYQMGAKGAGSSNLAMASWASSLESRIVDGWMSDEDPFNIDRVGHRRWVLNPTMEETGFGEAVSANGYHYYAMYAFDMQRSEADYYGVCWPAQNMPLEFFGNYMPWSISMGKVVDASKVQVKLTRQSDNKVWTFSTASSSNGEMYVDNGGYGQTGCIIFRPNDVTYNVGDAFKVEITGMDEKVSYTVRFFSLDESTPIIKEEKEDPTQTGTTAPSSGMGDVNGNNKVDLGDAQLVLKSALKITTLDSAKSKKADVNVDGQVNLTDAQLVLKYALKIINSFS